MKFTSLTTLLALTLVGCGDDAKEAVQAAAEDAIEDAIEGAIPDLVPENDVGVNTPKGWDFLIAIEVNGTTSAAFDSEFSISLAAIENAIAATGAPGLPAVENQLVLAKVEDLGQPYGKRLRFSRKAAIVDGELKVDNEINLGTSGDLGAGTYVFYHSQNRVGFFKGSVSDCDGNPSDGALVVSPSSPFMTYTEGGRWAIPSITANPTSPGEGQASQVFFEQEECSGSVLMAAPEEEANPKTADIPAEESGEPTVEKEFSEDGTAVAEAPAEEMKQKPEPPPPAEPEPEPEPEDTGEPEDSGEPVEPEEPEEPPAPTEVKIDFEGVELADICSWDSSSNDAYAYAAILSDYHDLFFPTAEGEDTNYLFLSSGGSGRTSSTVYCSVTVPDEATKIDVSYNFISQEYAEWVGSGFNDIFTVKVDGSPDTVLSRTINNAGSEQLWEDISDENARAVGAIADSNDAAYNNTGRKFDGQLKVNARGAKIDESGSPFATGDISKHQGQEIIIMLTVADAGDSIFDTAALVDYIHIH